MKRLHICSHSMSSHPYVTRESLMFLIQLVNFHFLISGVWFQSLLFANFFIFISLFLVCHSVLSLIFKISF